MTEIKDGASVVRGFLKSNQLTCLLHVLGVFALLFGWRVLLLALFSGLALSYVLRRVIRLFRMTLDM